TSAWIALAGGLGVAIAAGLANGMLVAVLGGASFIMTLASGQAMNGAEYAVTGQKTIFEGIPEGFMAIAGGHILGLSNEFWLALIVFAVLWIVVERSELGRAMYAVGGNREAARLSGIDIRRVRIIGYVGTAVCCFVAAILLTSQTQSYSPGLGSPY